MEGFQSRSLCAVVLAVAAATVAAQVPPRSSPADVGELRAAVLRNPASAQAHNELGAALGERGDLDGALRELDAAVRLDPGDAEALFNLGATCMRRAKLAGSRDSAYYRELDRGLTALRRAVQIQPEFP